MPLWTRYETHTPPGAGVPPPELASGNAPARRLISQDTVEILRPDGVRQSATAVATPELTVGDVLRAGRRFVRVV